MNIKSLKVENAIFLYVRDVNGRNAEIIVHSKVKDEDHELALLASGIISFLRRHRDPDKSCEALFAAIDYFFNDPDIIRDCRNGKSLS